MKMQQDSRLIAKLIVSFLKDELSESEKKDFKVWLDADPKNVELLESFKQTSSVQKEIDFVHKIDANEAWNKLADQLTLKPVAKLNWNKLIAYGSVAVLLIVAGIGLYTYKLKDNKESIVLAQNYDIKPGSTKAVLQMANGTSINLDPTAHLQKNTSIEMKDGFLVYKAKNPIQKGYNLLRTPRAGEYKMILPDGTKVYLNSSSAIRFSTDFNKTDRRVQLVGEAYFEVAHNEALPFIVTFNKNEVEVLGTHFNISSYKNTSKTTLLEGAIKIRSGENQTILKPGDEADINNGDVKVAKVDTYKSIAWKEGMFYFHEDKMTDILDQVSRWYNVKIEYKGVPGTKKYSGDIRRQATLNQVLEMLNAVSGTRFALKDRTVTVNF